MEALTNRGDREEIALRIFCAFLSRQQSKIDLDPSPGEPQIRTSFALADTFLRLANELPDPVGFTCPKCGRVSYNPNDVKNRYCGACHEFFYEDKPEGVK